ncbi:helix-loop-helix dna-binding domain-containing protein [Apiospora hydei]|uniref:Helix-loop-helix dna-binding domain-containing protein n=1 Tax=Apiospora hydei TaxID=1337664 RepID=A0ABR1X339_9PEZI
MPPTPNSSTEMKGKDGVQQMTSMQMSFELPPSAMGGKDAARPASSESKTSSPAASSFQPSDSKTTYPVQARAIRITAATDKVAEDHSDEASCPGRSCRAPSPAATPGAAGKVAAATAASKKKQPAATSAAGRKIARKTAHSLIERRRRSKMNEEFAVLKDLIPACTGEMHKLAILQASIDYVRYLEDCVAKLKSQNESQSSARTPTEFALPPPISRNVYQEDDLGDVEMTGSEAPSPTYTPSTSRSQRPSESPALLAEDARHRQNSYSSVSTDHRHYSYSASTQASPAFGPQQYNYNFGAASASNSTLTSPALPPLRDMDQEASAALLMLNTDRRGTSGSGAGRGMSVRDLLSA